MSMFERPYSSVQAKYGTFRGSSAQSNHLLNKARNTLTVFSVADIVVVIVKAERVVVDTRSVMWSVTVDAAGVRVTVDVLVFKSVPLAMKCAPR